MFVPQDDCNFVRYHGFQENQDQVWSTGTTIGSGNCALKLQVDGNIVLYHDDGSAKWSPQTQKTVGHRPYYLWVTNAGDLELLSGDGLVLWKLSDGDTANTPVLPSPRSFCPHCYTARVADGTLCGYGHVPTDPPVDGSAHYVQPGTGAFLHLHRTWFRVYHPRARWSDSASDLMWIGPKQHDSPTVCFESVMSHPDCQKWLFSWVPRGDGNCGCLQYKGGRDRFPDGPVRTDGAETDLYTIYEVYERTKCDGWCASCPPGYEINGTAKTCVPCPQGTFKDEDMVSCAKCPGRQETVSVASASIRDCYDVSTDSSNLWRSMARKVLRIDMPAIGAAGGSAHAACNSSCNSVASPSPSSSYNESCPAGTLVCLQGQVVAPVANGAVIADGVLTLADDTYAELPSDIAKGFGTGDFSVKMTYQGHLADPDASPDGVDLGMLWVRSTQEPFPYTGPTAFIRDTGNILFRMAATTTDELECPTTLQPASTAATVLQFTRIRDTLSIFVNDQLQCSKQISYDSAWAQHIVSAPLRFGANHVTGTIQNLNAKLSDIELVELNDANLAGACASGACPGAAACAYGACPTTCSSCVSPSTSIYPDSNENCNCMPESEHWLAPRMNCTGACTKTGGVVCRRHVCPQHRECQARANARCGRRCRLPNCEDTDELTPNCPAQVALTDLSVCLRRSNTQIGQ